VSASLVIVRQSWLREEHDGEAKGEARHPFGSLLLQMVLLLLVVLVTPSFADYHPFVCSCCLLPSAAHAAHQAARAATAAFCQSSLWLLLVLSAVSCARTHQIRLLVLAVLWFLRIVTVVASHLSAARSSLQAAVGAGRDCVC
jgi:hypothetical protein